MYKIFVFIILTIYFKLFSQNNPELFELQLNISNIESEGNLVIAVWSNPSYWNGNVTNSLGQKEGFDYGFKEWVEKKKFSKTINLPKGVYFISILLDQNSNNILDIRSVLNKRKVTRRRKRT